MKGPCTTCRYHHDKTGLCSVHGGVVKGIGCDMYAVTAPKAIICTGCSKFDTRTNCCGEPRPIHFGGQVTELSFCKNIAPLKVHKAIPLSGDHAIITQARYEELLRCEQLSKAGGMDTYEDLLRDAAQLLGHATFMENAKHLADSEVDWLVPAGRTYGRICRVFGLKPYEVEMQKAQHPVSYMVNDNKEEK